MLTTTTENERKVELFKYTDCNYTDYYIIVELNDHNECVIAKIIIDNYDHSSICLKTMITTLRALYGTIDFYDASAKESDSDHIYNILHDFVEKHHYKYSRCNMMECSKKDKELWLQMMEIKFWIKLELFEEGKKRNNNIKQIKKREECMAKVKRSGFVNEYDGATCLSRDIIAAYED